MLEMWIKDFAWYLITPKNAEKSHVPLLSFPCNWTGLLELISRNYHNRFFPYFHGSAFNPSVKGLAHQQTRHLLVLFSFL